MKILVTGASGLLGNKIYNILSKKFRTIGTSYKKNKSGTYNLDIRVTSDVFNLFEMEHPDVVVHAAALTDIDLCENDKELARSVNVEGTTNIVMACRLKKSKLIYISSDYVFGAKPRKEYTEKSQPCPVNYYGRTKLEGENIVSANLDDYIIVRPGILYGYNDEDDKETFTSKVFAGLEKGRRVYVDDRVIKYPTLIDDVALGIKRLIELGSHGIYHIASSQPLTRYDWARKIASIYGLPKENIIAKNENYSVRRPLNVLLDTSKIRKLGVVISDVDEGTMITKQERECFFRLLYCIRPGMEILKEDISDFRISLGKRMAREIPADADIVVPIPETGIFPAMGFAHESKIPLYHGLIKNDDLGRLLYEPSQANRSEKIKAKIIPINSLLKNKRVILIDEAIITGITMDIVIKMLKKAKAKEIHVRTPCPPFISACIAKQHPVGDLIARKYSVGRTRSIRHKNIEKGLKRYFGVDSLMSLSLDILTDSLKYSKYEKCIKCFVGEDER